MNARPEMQTVAHAALEYAALGWHVFPAPPGKKQSYEKGEDHDGRRWGASDDPETVAAMFAKWPGANVGIATWESGLVVIDLDRKNGVDGIAWMQERIAEHGPLPATVEACSPSGSWHIYFRYPEGFDPKTCESEIAPGVDVRGHGGMVIAPPSVKPGEARAYEWINPPGFFDPADAPQWLLDRLPRRGASKGVGAVVSATADDWRDFSSAPRQGFRFDDGAPEASRAEAEEIVGSIDPDCGYDDWLRVLMGLHDRFGGSAEGFAIADAWSARGAKDRPGEVAAKWRGFQPGGGAGWGTVCEIARRHGADLSEIARRHRGSGRVHVGRSFVGGDPAREGEDAEAYLAATTEDAGPDDDALDLSDDALALEMGRRRWNRDAKYCAAWGRWLFWDGARWCSDDRMHHLTATRHFLRERAWEFEAWAQRKAASVRDPQKFLDWAKKQARSLRSKTTVAAVESLARGNTASVATPDDFDADPMALGTPGGVVDLRTGALRPARREDMITRLTAAKPEAGRPERWLRFLHEIFKGDAEVIAFMQRAAGYALTGMTTEHKLLFLYGTGRNGKSVLINTLFSILGDYARRASATTFLNTGQEKHPTDLAGLRGARLVAASELPKGRTWDESVIKDLTGGDKMTARFMRGDFFDFDPQLTLMIAGNNMPSFRGVDEAIRARVVLVPFLVTIPPERRDRDLPAKLAAEGGRILAWAIEGAVAWNERGLDVPRRLLDASAEYFDDEDTLGQFLADETEADPGAFTTTTELHARFVDWCGRQGLTPWTLRTLQKEVTGRGFPTLRRNHGRGFAGLRLRPGWTVGGGG